MAPARDLLNDEPIPKSVARVLNAAKIREEYKAKKRKNEEEGGLAGSEKRRKIEETAKSKLTIKPGESIQHFNR